MQYSKKEAEPTPDNALSRLLIRFANLILSAASHLLLRLRLLLHV